uniref:Uncharacterized protein n=1 Tax=viral metagenome TaxID=1070528 RepID=A0A6C0DLT9_9ZZZZ
MSIFEKWRLSFCKNVISLEDAVNTKKIIQNVLA